VITRRATDPRMIHCTRDGSLKSAPSVWPLQRADGTRWNEAPKPGYNPLGKARDAD